MIINKVKIFLKSFFYSWLWLLIPLLIVDQATKMWAHFGEWNITLIPNFLHLTYVRNTGAAWSMLSGQMGLLAVVSAVVGTAIALFRYFYRHKLNTFKKILIAIILAGAWGNFIDRAFYKLILGTEGVVDFIHFQFGSYHFPIFNVADMCVTLGILTYAILITLEDFNVIKPKKEVKAEEKEEIKQDENESNNSPDA